MKLIPLTQGQFTKVDDEDFERFGVFKWYAFWNPTVKSFYARRNLARDNMRCQKRAFLHRVIMDTPLGMVTDHKNHDTLDNQKENLRVCTNSQNMANRKGLEARNTSGFRGVSWKNRDRRWTTQIEVNGKSIHLGHFLDKSEAIIAYAVANKKYFGEFGGLQHVGKQSLSSSSREQE